MKKTMLNMLAWMTGVSRNVWSFLAPLLARATADLLETLLPMALAIVTELAATNMSGRDKQRIAKERLQAEAFKAGMDVGASLLNTAVELAVQKLKEGAR